jgi:hypothetical protein
MIKKISQHVHGLSLIEISGPFLAVSVLEEVFPQGLDAAETPLRRKFRMAYDELQDTEKSDSLFSAIHKE